MARDLDVQLKLTALTKGFEALKKITSDLKGVGKEVERVGKKFKGLGKTLSLTVTTPLVALGGLAIKSAADLETLTTAFEGLTGSAEKASKIVKDLQRFTANTPFQFESVGSAGRALLAFGVEADDVVNKLTTLGNIAAGSNSDLEGLAQIYGKVLSAGKLTGETLLQFAERGIPLNRELAATLGVQESAIRDLVSNGQIGLEQLNATFANLTTGAGLFAGQIEKQSQTINGVISTLKDNVALALADLGQEIVKTFNLKDVLRQITIFVQNSLESFRNLSAETKRFIVILGSIAAAIGPVSLAFGVFLTSVNPFVAIITVAVASLGFLLDKFDLIESSLNLVRNAFNATLGSIRLFGTVITESIGNVVIFTTRNLADLLSTLGLFVTRVGNFTNSKSLINLGFQLSETADEIQNFKRSLDSAINGADVVRFEVEAVIPDVAESTKKITDQLNAATSTAKIAIPPLENESKNKFTEDIESLAELGEERLTDTANLLTNSFAGAFTDISTGTKGVASAFDDLAQSIIRSLTQRALTNAIGSIVGSLGGTTGPSTTGVPGFATGGEVRGPGTGTSDSILARLSNGEFVSDAKTVRHFGSDFFKRLKKMARGNTPAFATGGLVNMANGLQNHINSAPLPKFRDGGLVNTGQTGVQMPNVNISINNNGSTSQVVDQNTSFDGRDLFIELFLEDMQNNGKVSQALQGTFGLNR